MMLFEANGRPGFDSRQAGLHCGNSFQEKRREERALRAAHDDKIVGSFRDDRRQGFAGGGIHLLARRADDIGQPKQCRQVDLAPERMLLLQLLQLARVLGKPDLVDH